MASRVNSTLLRHYSNDVSILLDGWVCPLRWCADWNESCVSLSLPGSRVQPPGLFIRSDPLIVSCRSLSALRISEMIPSCHVALLMLPQQRERPQEQIPHLIAESEPCFHVEPVGPSQCVLEDTKMWSGFSRLSPCRFTVLSSHVFDSLRPICCIVSELYPSAIIFLTSRRSIRGIDAPIEDDEPRPNLDGLCRTLPDDYCFCSPSLPAHFALNSIPIYLLFIYLSILNVDNYLYWFIDLLIYWFIDLLIIFMRAKYFCLCCSFSIIICFGVNFC